MFTPMKTVRIPTLRAVLLFFLIIGSGGWAYSGIEAIRQRYQDSVVDTIDAGKENVAYKNAASEILKQKELFQGWSVLVLAGIVTILITTKIHRAQGIVWVYLVLGPAAIFLITSLYAGWVLTKRYTYLVAKNNYSDFNNLSALLDRQSDLFLYAIGCVSLFAGWFLLLTVLGKLEPFEMNQEAGNDKSVNRSS
jgi:hypothetical protein